MKKIFYGIILFLSFSCEIENKEEKLLNENNFIWNKDSSMRVGPIEQDLLINEPVITDFVDLKNRYRKCDSLEKRIFTLGEIDPETKEVYWYDVLDTMKTPKLGEEYSKCEFELMSESIGSAYFFVYTSCMNEITKEQREMVSMQFKINFYKSSLQRDSVLKNWNEVIRD